MKTANLLSLDQCHLERVFPKVIHFALPASQPLAFADDVLNYVPAALTDCHTATVTAQRTSKASSLPSFLPTHHYTSTGTLTHTHTHADSCIGHRRCQDLGSGSHSRDCYVALVYDDDVSCWTPGLGFQSPCCACFYRPCLAVVDECRCCWPLLKSALLVGVMSA